MIGDEPKLMDVPVTKDKDPGWGHCKVCGAGYLEEVSAKGLCHDCRRWKQFLKPVLDALQELRTCFTLQGVDNAINGGSS